MERYPKLFILAAIGYLLIGVLLGMHIVTLSSDPSIVRFVHVHLNLLGFMAMFIYGVAYHILPRFNGKPLAKPYLVQVHFYLANAGLLGMCGFALADGLYGAGMAHTGFLVASFLEVAAIFLFAWNLVPVLLPEKAVIEMPKVDPAMKVADLLEKWPGLSAILTESGLKALTSPNALKSFARGVTIDQACRIHKLDFGDLSAKLNKAIADGSAGKAASSTPALTPEKKATDAMAKGKKITRGEKAVADTLIGSLLEVYPETRPVFEKNYGEGCFSCPGQAFETLGQTAGMHGIGVDAILADVNAIIEKVNK